MYFNTSEIRPNNAARESPTSPKNRAKSARTFKKFSWLSGKAI